MIPVVINRAVAELLRRKRVVSGLRGERWVEGGGLMVQEGCRIEPFAQFLTGNVLPLAFGAFSYTHSVVSPHVRVGRYGSIGRNVEWAGERHPLDWVSTSPAFYDPDLPAAAAFRSEFGGEPPPPYEGLMPIVDVGHDVWIGDGAMVMPGVAIGHGAVVGARALVTKDVPPYAIVVGQPARVVRTRIPEHLVARMLEAQWWRYAPNVLQPLPMDDPERFLDALAQAREARPQVLKPTPLTSDEILAAANA